MNQGMPAPHSVRASTKPVTTLAPAALSNRAAVNSEEPVVITSSTSTTRLSYKSSVNVLQIPANAENH